MMIWDIEYWMENGRIMRRKVYMTDQGKLMTAEKKPGQIVEFKKRISGELEDEATF